MLKRLWVIPVLLLVLSCLPADAYTVILKNGKVMKGTLISESDQKIVFKDEHGMQFSLNKSTLDVGKMQEANTAPPPPPPAAETKPATPAAPASKKPARVYTAADLQAVRDRVGLSTSSGDAGEMVDPASPAGYYKGLMEAVSRITGVTNDLGGLLDGMNTDWEVSSSTGRDPAASLQKYKGSKAFTDLSQSIKSNLSELQSLRDSMQPPLQGFQDAYSALDRSVNALYSYYDAIQVYAGDPPVPAFRASIQNYGDTVDAALGVIQAVPAPAQPEPAPSDNQPSDDSQAPANEGDSQPPPQ